MSGPVVRRGPLAADARGNPTGRRLLGLALVACAVIAAAAAVRGSAATSAVDHTLTVVVPGGNATVSVEPAGGAATDCTAGNRCTYSLAEGSSVTLTATDQFFGWTGDCADDGSSCTRAMSVDRTVGMQRRLRVTVRGEDSADGSGTVRITPPGVTCPSDCVRLSDGDNVVALTATANTGSFLYRFDPCSDFDLEATCRVRTTQIDNDVDAIFLPDATLQVGVTGNDASVTAAPGGDCDTNQFGGGACNFPVARGTRVTLTPDPPPGSRLVGWSVPECTGTGACTITMDSRLRSVVATFLPTELTVITSNTGNVRTNESPPRIDCGGDSTCEADYETLGPVTLTASPASAFRGWSGACEPAGTAPVCTLERSGDDVVGAWFAGPEGPPEIIPPRIDFALEVKKGGNGNGTVTSTRSRLSDAIRCGAGIGCDAVFQQGETARLTATPAAGSSFAGWKAPSGLCSTGNTCRFQVMRASRFEATFTKGRCASRKLGGRRADRLTGTAGGDTIFGRGGNDRIRGLRGDDCLFGEGGKDVLRGDAGADALSGGAGADDLDGGPGRDTVKGGAGADRIAARDGVRDVIVCGPGRDTVRADKGDTISGCERVRRR
jgi:RTX calcium-binding nonapeptide repeat (4 copies)/Divergent InlB B-repeat domain